MKINEVMRETGLTKKAIYYYEEEGLISPRKDEENNYRVYSEEDVQRLVTIHALRKLDFPVRDIYALLTEEMDIKQAIKKQLKEVNEKIQFLGKKRSTLESLIEKDPNSIVEDLKATTTYLDEYSKNAAGYMQKELDRILPGNLGKMFAIHYEQFLDEPLDNEVKRESWENMIKLLDSLEEIQYPEEIKEIIEERYNKLSEDDLTRLKEKSVSITNQILTRKEKVSEELKTQVQEKIKEYESNPEYQEKRDLDLKLQQFMKQNLMPVFEEVNKYVCILSSRFEKFPKNLV